MSAAPKIAQSPVSSRQEGRRSATTLRRDVKLSLCDGIGFALMVGLGETYIPAFVIAIGLGEVNSGLITTLPLLVGAMIQLAAPMMIGHFRSYRRWAVLCSSVQALTFIPLVIASFFGYLPAPALFLIAAIYWGTSMSMSAAWNSWIGAMTPPGIRTGFCATRNRWNQAFSMFGFLLGGWFLKGSQLSGKIWPFALVFGVSFLARGVSSWLMSKQTDFVPPRTNNKPMALSEIFGILKKHPKVIQLLFYFLCVQFAVYTSAPYFTAYLLKHIKFSYPDFAILTAAAFAGRVWIYPWLAKCGREHGTHALLWTGGVGICVIPLLWLFSANFWYLFVVELLTGFVWAAFELATVLMVFETMNNEVRIAALTFYNVANAIVISIASLLGASLLDVLSGKTRAYLLLFALSALARMLTIVVLRKVTREKTRWIPLAAYPLAAPLSRGFIYPFQKMRGWGTRKSRTSKFPPKKAA